jgi:SAM-dependent methyltransferase
VSAQPRPAGPGSRAGPGEDFFEQHLRAVPPHRVLLRAVECKLMGAVSPRHPVLDIGIGDGHFASVAYTEPIDVGVDTLWSDLTEAAARPNVYRSVAQASATALPFPDACFNTVVSNCVIEHIPDLDGTLGEIARVLRPGGRFATTLPSEHFGSFLLGSTILRALRLPRLASAYGDFFNRISHHHHVHSPDFWHAKLSAAGLPVEEHRYYFSAAAHRAFDLSHYLGLPNLVSRGLLRKWVLHPAQMRPYGWWLRRYYDEPWPEVGAYQFVVCVKRSERSPTGPTAAQR